jgi:hypothetical protein
MIQNTFTTKLRNNRNGVPCVAPFINDWNVWDIPLKEWTPAVQAALVRAFEIGCETTAQRVKEAAATSVNYNQIWKSNEPR